MWGGGGVVVAWFRAQVSVLRASLCLCLTEELKRWKMSWVERRAVGWEMQRSWGKLENPSSHRCPRAVERWWGRVET